jgi:TrmH family RNA methyltransferase
MGALFKADFAVVRDGEEFVRSLVKKGRRVLAACPAGDSLILGRDKVLPDDCVIIGNEGHGVSENILGACTSSLLIPMEENTESLNASAAASVILWEYARG